MFEGRDRARVFAPDGVPPPGFEPAAATLEDAYLTLMRNADLLPELQAAPARGSVA